MRKDSNFGNNKTIKSLVLGISKAGCLQSIFFFFLLLFFIFYFSEGDIDRQLKLRTSFIQGKCTELQTTPT